MKTFKRVFSFFLVLICLYVFSIGNTAKALSDQAQEAKRIYTYSEKNSGKNTDQPNNAKAEKEEEEKRQENIKHFLRDDMTVEACIYPFPVHYKKNGKWVDIDNRLEATKDENGKAVLSNREGSYSVKFANDSSDKQIVSIKKDGYSISWQLSDTKRNAKAEVAKQPDPSDDIRVLPNLVSGVRYADLYGEGDLNYVATPNSVTELIELTDSSNIAPYYSVTISCKGLTPKVSNNEISLLNEKGEEIFRINAPYMTDAQGEVSYDVALQLVPVKEKKEKPEEEVLPQSSPAPTLEVALAPVVETSPEAVPEATAETDLDATPEMVVAVTPEPKPEATQESIIEPTEEIISNESIDEISGMTSNNGMIEFTYRMIPSAEWLNAKERAFPVILDPTVLTSLSSSQVWDTYACANYPSTNYYTSTKLRMGYGSSSGINRSFVKFPNLPTLSAGDMVVSATMSLSRYNANSSNDLRIDLHRITSDWTSNTLTWNNKPSYDTTRVEAISYSVLPGSFNEWDITRLVKQWYNGTANYGFMLKQYDETWGYLEYYSVDAANYYSSHPYAAIVYVNTTGIENSWTYHSQSIGRAGTVSVNDYNGNLTLIHSDTNIASGIMPVAVSHVFNSNDKSVNLGYGLGWRVNYAQTAVPVTIGGINYYKHIDGDGTAHYYKQSSGNTSVYENELDKETTLTVSGTTKTIADKQGNKLIFDSNGRLNQMQDSNANALSITYNTNGTIASVVDGASRTTTFAYGADGNLSSIDSPDGLDVSYTYTSARLTAITYADNRASSYTYNPNGDLTRVQNFDGYKVDYGYTSISPYRVASISESSNSITGGSVSIAYSWNSTIFTDNANRKSIYQFNNAGQTIAIRDVDGSAQFCEFNTGARETTTLKNVSKLQKTSINLLANHNMEATSAWTFTSGASYSTTAAYMGAKSIKLTSANTTTAETASQTVTLTPGKTYTLSAYFKGTDGCVVSVLYGTTELDSTGIHNVSGDWGRESLTFTLPSGAGSNVAIRVKMPAAVTGTTYVDCVMLEEASAMNRYNLLENGDFNSSGTNWARGSTLTASDALVTVSDSLHPASLNTTVYKLTGSTTSDKVVSQTVNIAGAAGDCYTIGGWALVNTIPAFKKNAGLSNEVNYGQRKISIGFVGASETKYYSVSFNPDSTDWQYACGAAIAPFAYTSMIFRFEYNYNCNEAWFDGMQLYKEEFKQSFTYDANGNVISVQGLANQNNAFEYNGSNDLIKATDAKGNKFNYTYDVKHNLLTATSDSGMKYTFTYDAKGNALTSKAGSDTDYIQTSASYTNTGSFLESITDARGNTVGYTYDTNKGLRSTVTDAKNVTSTYTYDTMKRLTGLSQPVNGSTAQVTYGYTNDDLTQVTHNGFSYGIGYDAFGNTTGTNVNGTALATNTYTYSRGLLSNTVYGNGLTVNYTYDEMDRVTGVSFGTTPMYSYSYDGEGNLQRLVDLVRNVTTTFFYDLSGRLIRSSSSDGSEYRYDYDLNNNLTKLYQTAAGSNWTTQYTYDADNRPVTVTAGGKTITDTYNATGTRANRTYGFTTPYTVALSYLSGANGSKTGMVQTYQNGSEDAYVYEYDANGNITSITQGWSQATYTYDDMNQLVRVNDGFANLTTTYTYDLSGNILERNEYDFTTGALGTPTDTVAYTYNTTWRDRLGSYDGQAITCDAIGNPLIYRGFTMTWQGKRLSTLSGNGTTASYTYNEQGVRTSKTVNSVVTNYSYNGSLLMAQVTGSGAGQIKQLYSYDAAGQLVSVNYNGTEYYYMRNGQNDIVGLMDNSGAVVVSYSYDSWGKSLTVSGTLATTLGANNPFRYRGYYYDTETGLYYLQTRYYDAEVGRFISADVYLSTGQGIVGNNTYVYCLNNSVCSHDDLGAIAIADDLLIGGALLLVTLFATTCFAVSQNADIPIATSFSLDNLVARAKESIKQTQLVVSSLFVGVVLASKPINLPAARKVTINSDHIKNNHTNKGNGGPQKDKFPDTMKLVAIERTIRAAYKVAEKIQSQGDRVLLRGNGNGMTIIMWLNKVTKIIETAWPKFK